MTAVAFDAVSAGLTGATSGATGQTLAHTAASGADVFLAIEIDFTGAPSSVQYNGQSLTLLASIASNNGSLSVGLLSLYRGAGMGTGSSANFTFTIPSLNHFVAGSVSYTGVFSVGTAATNFGSSASPSTGAVTVSGGGSLMALAAVGYGNSNTARTISSVSGGTNRYNAADATSHSGVSLADSTSTDTFGMSLSGSTVWSTIAVILSPPSVPGPGWVGPVQIPNPFVGPMALRQTKRLPYVAARAASGTQPVAYDQSGSGYGQTIVGATGSWTHTATQGAYVIAAIHVHISDTATANDITGVTYGGTSMQLLYTNYANASDSSGYLAFYGLANAPPGLQTVQFTLGSGSSNAPICANSFSYTGVASVSPLPWPAYGSTGAAFSMSVTNAANSMVFQAFGCNSGQLSGVTGADIKWNASTSTNAALAVQDTTAVGPTTFSATPPVSAAWCGMGMVLSPLPAPTYSAPFSASLTKFGNQQNVAWQLFGDSTAVGVNDGQSLNGWIGRLGIILGNYYDYNVSHRQYSTASGGTYGVATTLRSSPRGGAAPTLLIYNGGVGGTEITSDLTELLTENLAAIANPDAIFTADGINDMANSKSPFEFTTLFTVFLGFLANYYCPNVPIIVTTQNPLGQGDASLLVFLQANFSALAQSLVGQGTPLGSAIVQGANNNVSVLDTQQAYHYQYQSSIISASDGVHPNEFGYQVQANWMASVLAPWTATPIGASCPPVQIPNPFVGPMALRQTKRLPYVGLPTPITVSPTGATVTATPDSPAVTAPYVASPIGASTTATPGTPSIPINPTGASTTATPGTPVVTSPELISPTGASATATPGTPTVTAPNTVAPDGVATAATGGIPVVTERVPNITLSPTGATVTATGDIPDVQGAAVSQEIVIVPPSRSAVVWR